MKKTHLMMVVILVLLLGGIFIFLLQSKAAGKTIEEAIEKSSRQVVKIIHEEKVKGGEVVFFYKSINGGKDFTVASGYIKKTLWGWEWVYGGEHSHSEPGQPMTAQYFPTTQNTPFPLAFGEISDPQIVRVSVQTAKRIIEKEGRIVQNNNMRIWFVFLNSLDCTKIEVTGLSQSGQTIASKGFSL